jgi:hypothetical protein
MVSEEEKEHTEKINEYREIIKFFEECLSDDPIHASTYIKVLEKIRINPVKMARKAGIAFGEVYRKNHTAKALTKNLLNLMDDNDAGQILHFCERSPRNWIETSGEYLILGKKLREACKVPDDYKTSDERIQELIAETPKQKIENIKEVVKEEIKMPEKKSFLKKRFELIHSVLNKKIPKISFKPAYESVINPCFKFTCENSAKTLKFINKSAVKPALEFSEKNLLKPLQDFLYQDIEIKNHHWAVLLPLFLIGTNYWGNMKSTKRNVDYCINSGVNFCDDIPNETYKFGKNTGKTIYSGAKNIAKGCGNFFESNFQYSKDIAAGGWESCKDGCRDIKKRKENAWGYITKTSTTTANSGKKFGNEIIKEKSLIKYLPKAVWEEGIVKTYQSVYKYIDNAMGDYARRSVERDSEIRKIEKQGKKK